MERHKNWLLYLLFGALVLLLTGCSYTDQSPEKKYDYVRIGTGRASFMSTTKLILFNMRGVRFKGLFLMTGAGRIIKCLRKDGDERVSFSASPSPDGKKIAFTSYAFGKNGGLYIMDSDGRNIRRLTITNQYRDSDSSFSHDGKTIYFIRDKNPDCMSSTDPPCSDESYLMKMPVTGEGPYDVTREPLKRIYDFGILPGYNEIIASIDTKGLYDYQLVTMDMVNTRLKAPIIPDLRAYTDDPRVTILNKRQEYIDIKYFRLSTDGKYLVFSWDNTNTKAFKNYSLMTQLYITDMANMKTKKLTNLQYVGSPEDISGDNLTILFSAGRSMKDYGHTYFPKSTLWIISSDGTGLRNIPLDFSAVADQFPPTKPAAGTAK